MSRTNSLIEQGNFFASSGSAGFGQEVSFSSSGSVSQSSASRQVSTGASSGSAGAVSKIAQDLLLFNQSNGRASGASSRAAGGASFISGGGSTSFSGSFNSGSASINAGGASGALIAGGASGALIAGGAAGSGAYISAIEQSILRSTVPVEVTESENLTVKFGDKQETGIWANRQEVINWKGVIPITEYIINEDSNPEVITKRTEQQLVYIQELAIRYLRPPTPPAPGDILIKHEASSITAPAPPLVIRQIAARADTPEPLVIREAPPTPPAAVGSKIITISGKRIPPPPRKVVIERLAPLPSKPQSVLVERWLPYAQAKRRVIFQRASQADAVVVKPRNVIVQWEAPQVVIKKEFKYLGVIRANPVEYVERYKHSLKFSKDLPDLVLDFKTPEGLVLAADYKYNSVHELEGDVKALGFVDLEREGLGEYQSVLSKLGITFVGAANVSNAASQYNSTASFSASSGASASGALGAAGSLSGNFGIATSLSGSGFSSGSASGLAIGSASGSALSGSSNDVIASIFASIDTDNSGLISIDEAALILLRLNSRLGRSYGEDDAKAIFNVLDSTKKGQLSLDDFRHAFAKLL